MEAIRGCLTNTKFHFRELVMYCNIQGKSVEEIIKVNGVVVASDLTGEVNIKWEGDHPANLNSDASVSCKIHGNWYVESLEF